MKKWMDVPVYWYNFVWSLTVLLLFGIWSKKQELRGSLWESLLHNFVWVKGLYWHKRQNEEIQRRKICQRWMRRYTLWLKSSCVADFWKLDSTLRKWWLMPAVSVGEGFLRYLLWSTVRGRIWEQKAIWSDLAASGLMFTKDFSIILPCVVTLSDNQWFLKCILTSLAAKCFSMYWKWCIVSFFRWMCNSLSWSPTRYPLK